MEKPSLLYRVIKGLVRFFYPKLEVVGAENLPQEAAIIVGNHTQMNGPIAAELYCPGKHYTSPYACLLNGLYSSGERRHEKSLPYQNGIGG